MIRNILSVLFGLVLALPCHAAPCGNCLGTRAPDPIFQTLQGCAVVTDANGAVLYLDNRRQADVRYRPCSTFKIPNALIALDSGVADGPDFPLAWDPLRDPLREDRPRDWYQDQTLRSAFERSALWYYREIARRIGPERMQRYVDRFAYGNRDTAGLADPPFWLEGGMAISAMEQVAFLRRMWMGELGVSSQAVEVVKDMMVQEHGRGWTLGGKTGLGEVGRGQLKVGWYVGYVERDGEVYFFALNLVGTGWDPVMNERIPLAHRMLDSLGLREDLP